MGYQEKINGTPLNGNEDLNNHIIENKEEKIQVKQDPEFGGDLDEKEVFQIRKHLSELIEKASKLHSERDSKNKEKELSKIREEISKIMGNQK